LPHVFAVAVQGHPTKEFLQVALPFASNVPAQVSQLNCARHTTLEEDVALDSVCVGGIVDLVVIDVVVGGGSDVWVEGGVGSGSAEDVGSDEVVPVDVDLKGQAFIV
jgi:hypothetical protein